jgi:hypothetical protein
MIRPVQTETQELLLGANTSGDGAGWPVCVPGYGLFHRRVPKWHYFNFTYRDTHGPVLQKVAEQQLSAFASNLEKKYIHTV